MQPILTWSCEFFNWLKNPCRTWHVLYYYSSLPCSIFAEKKKRLSSFLRSTFITVLQCMSYILMIIVLLELLQLRMWLLDCASFLRKPRHRTTALTWLLGMKREKFVKADHATRARCTFCTPPAHRRRSSWDLSSFPPP